MPKPTKPYRKREYPNGRLLLATRGPEYFSAIGKIGGAISAKARRSPGYTLTHCNLPVAHYQHLKLLAEAAGVSCCSLVREAVALYLDQFPELPGAEALPGADDKKPSGR